MDGAYHYRQSERLLEMALPAGPSTATRDELAAMLWMAHIHAELAEAAASLEGSGATVSQRWRDAFAQGVAPTEQEEQEEAAAGNVRSRKPSQSDPPARPSPALMPKRKRGR